MSTSTTNYGLIKPAANETADIAVINQNMDTLDTQMKNNADAAAGAIPKNIGTAVDQVLVSSGVGAWAVKTLAQFKTWLGLGSAAYTASSAYATSAQGKTADDASSALAAHQADNMPHRFTDTGTSKTYKWGLKVTNGIVSIIYEEVV